MSFPTNFNNLTLRIEEMLISGSGVSPYTITTGSFSAKYWYEGRLDSQLASDALTGPIIKVKIEEFKPSEPSWVKPNAKEMFDVTVAIDIGVRMDSKVLPEKRREIETSMDNYGLEINKVLSHPQNLLETNSGLPTGLVSGRLKFTRCTNIKHSYESSIGTATMFFDGKVVIQYE